MVIKLSILVFCTFALFAVPVFGQQMIVINNPTEKATVAPKSSAEESLIKKYVLPAVRKHWTSDVCDEDFRVSGVAHGAFSKPDSKQSLVFYSFCETGNGFGNDGLVLIENGKVVGSYISESGSALDLKGLPDINQNGLNEFLVYYSGGMHQGEGSSAADLMEFSTGGIKGLGWFQVDSYSENGGDYGYKVTVKPGKVPVFYREKYISVKENKWRKSGKATPLKLTKAYGKFTALK